MDSTAHVLDVLSHNADVFGKYWGDLNRRRQIDPESVSLIEAVDMSLDVLGSIWFADWLYEVGAVTEEEVDGVSHEWGAVPVTWFGRLTADQADRLKREALRAVYERTDPVEPVEWVPCGAESQGVAVKTPLGFFEGVF